MQQPIDELIEQHARSGSASFRGMHRRALALIRSHADLIELSESLPRAWAVSDTLQASLLKGLQLTELQGRAEIEQIVSPEFEEVWTLPFREAIERFRQRLNIPIEEWEAISAEWREYAFWISGITNGQLLADIRSLIDRSLTEGTGYREFEQEFVSKAEAAGWEPKDGVSRRARVVFDANMRTAHATGRWMQATKPHVLARFPEWEWRHRDSVVPRPHHLAMDGRRFTAPLPLGLPSGFGCFLGHEQVAIPGGWKRLDEFEIGDRVIGGSGETRSVTDTLKRPYCGGLTRVVLPHGREFSATPNHRILTLRGWIKAANLSPGDHLIQLSGLPDLELKPLSRWFVPPMIGGWRDIELNPSGVYEPEGFSPDASLAFCRSSEALTSWAGQFGSLTRVVAISTIHYEGAVYNLSVDVDESYCIPHAIVHNCRCTWIPRRGDGSATVNYELSDRLNPKTGETERVVHVPMVATGTGKNATFRYDPNGKPTPMADPGWMPPTNRTRSEVIQGMLAGLPADIRDRVEAANLGGPGA